MSKTIAKQHSDINTAKFDSIGSHKTKSCESSYTLADAEQKASDISNIALYLNSGAYPEHLGHDLMDHLQSEIEDLQSIIGYLRILPLIQCNPLESSEVLN